MTAIRIALLSAATASILSGCAPAGQTGKREKKSFDEPTFPANPTAQPVPLDQSLQTKAMNEITVAFNSADPITRAQALEASSRTNDPAAADRVLRALADKNWIVRFAGAMCAGDLKLRSTYKALIAAAFDTEPSVRVAVRYALHQLGDKALSKDLEALSIHPDPHVRSNVALVIGLLNEPSGVRVVMPLLTDSDFAVRMQAAEALWRLRDEQELGLKNLVAGTISKFPDDQIVSVLALAGPRDVRVKQFIVGKLSNDSDNKQYVELQLAAARALGMLRDDAGFGLAVKSSDNGDPRHRVLAAFALGEIRRLDGQTTLAKLLDDKNAEVRLAAATAIRQLAMPPR